MSIDKEKEMGDKAENAFRASIKRRNRLQGLKNTHVKVTDLHEQHKGDFRELADDTYTECKWDLAPDRRGNIFLEVGELYTSSYHTEGYKEHEADRGSIKMIGFFKQLGMKERAFQAHKMGEESDEWLVYEPDRLIKYLINEQHDELIPNAEFQVVLWRDLQHKERYKIALILGDWVSMRDSNNPIIRGCFRFVRTHELPEAIDELKALPRERGVKREKREAYFRELMRQHNVKEVFRKKGKDFDSYEITVKGD